MVTTNPAAPRKPNFIQRVMQPSTVRGTNKRSVGTGPSPVSYHKPRSNVGSRIHGVFKRMSGSVSNNKVDKAQGTRMMHGNTVTAGRTRQRKFGF